MLAPVSLAPSESMRSVPILSPSKPRSLGYQIDLQSDSPMTTRRKLLISIATLAVVVVALLLAPAQAQPSQQTECSFAGIWSTTYGQMPLQQSGTSLTGTYGAQGKK